MRCAGACSAKNFRTLSCNRYCSSERSKSICLLVPRQPEGAFADNIALNVGGAASDRVTERPEYLVHPAFVAERTGVRMPMTGPAAERRDLAAARGEQHGIVAGELERDAGDDEADWIGAVELVHEGIGAHIGILGRARELPEARIFMREHIGFELREPLPHFSVLDGRLAVALNRARETQKALILLAGALRAANRVALGRERGARNLPALPAFAHPPRVGRARIGEENFVESGIARYLPERPH